MIPLSGHDVTGVGHWQHKERRGSALILVLVAIIVIAVLATGAMMASMQEYRASRNQLVEQRALTIAEYGANSQFDSWGTTRNAMSVGAIDSSAVGIATGDTARIAVMRLNGTTYSVASTGRASIGNGVLEAQRQVNLLVHLTSPTITPGGAIVSYGNITVKGSISITGRNTNPPGWAGCPIVGVRDTFAIAYNPANTISVQKPASQAVNGTYADPNAGSANTFTVFGTETFASLAAKANAITTGASPSPVGTSTACTVGGNNWGEPSRGAGAVVGCQNYFPIIYSAGDLSINGGRGQGVLLVNGSLSINGNFTFDGLIVVMDDFRPNGNASVYGSVLIRNKTNSSTLGNGNASISYSRCAVSNAMSALAKPTRTKARSWSPL